MRIAPFPILIASLLCGCAPSLAPLDEPVTAQTESDYHRWLYRHKSKLRIDHAAKFTDAINTINLEAGLIKTGEDSTKRRTRLRELLHESSPREIIAYANWIHLHRLALENVIDVKMLGANAQQADRVRLGSEKSIGQSIRGQMHAIRVRINDRTAEAEVILDYLAELMPSVGRDYWAPSIEFYTDLPAKVVMLKCPSPRDLPKPPAS